MKDSRSLATTAEDAWSNAVVVKLPLKPDCDVNDIAGAEQALSSEYVSRYVEQIGARPTKAIAHIVKANVPLVTACIKATTRSQGALKDELQITPRAVQPDNPVQAVIPLAAAEQVTALLQLATSDQTGDQSDAAGQQQTDTAGPSKTSFVSLADKYMYPFHLRKRLANQPSPEKQAATAAAGLAARKMTPTDAVRAAYQVHSTAMKHSEASSNRPDGRLRRALTMSMSTGDTVVAGRLEAYSGLSGLTPDVMTELLQEFKVMPNTILPLQQEFVSSVRSWLSLLAPATVEGRVTDADVEAVAQLIQSPPVIKLLLTLLYYLYFEYVVGSPAFPQGLLGGVLTQAGAGVPIKQTGLRRRKKRQLEDRPEQHDLGCQLLLQVSKTSLNTTDTPLSISQSPLAGTSRHSQAGFILPERPQSTGSSMESSTQSLSCNTSARTSRRGSTAGSFSGERQRVTGGMSTLIQASDSSLTASSSSRLDERSSGSSTSQGNHEQQKAAILAGAGVAVLQQFRLAAMLQEWRNLQQQLRRCNAGLFFALPLLLLSIRSAVDRFFSQRFPAWMVRCAAGEAALQHIHAAVLDMLDSHGYHSQLPMLQSSPMAQQLRKRYDTAPKAPIMHHTQQTSMLMKATVGHPASAHARRLVAGSTAVSVMNSDGVSSRRLGTAPAVMSSLSSQGGLGPCGAGDAQLLWGGSSPRNSSTPRWGSSRSARPMLNATLNMAAQQHLLKAAVCDTATRLGRPINDMERKYATQQFNNRV
eukprot:jgi/Chrzof1/433/Cz01g15210.t1